jgi:hypothetical protein
LFCFSGTKKRTSKKKTEEESSLFVSLKEEIGVMFVKECRQQ